MNHIRKILKEETDRRDKLKDLMKRQISAGGAFNLNKVVNTFGVNHPILKELIIEWGNKVLQRFKSIKPTSEAEADFIKTFDGLYVDVRFQEDLSAILFLKGDPAKPEYWFELEDSIFWCSYIRIWKIFSKKYSMEYTDIQQFIKPMAEEAFRMSGIMPLIMKP